MQDQQKGGRKTPADNFPQPSLFQIIGGKVAWGLEEVFRRLTTMVTSYPILVIVICVLFCVVMLQFYRIAEQDSDQSNQLTPVDSQARRDKDWMQRYFGDPHIMITVFLVSEEALSKETLVVFQEYVDWMLHKFITPDGLSYKDVCARAHEESPCTPPVSALSLWSYNMSALKADPNVLATINNRVVWSRKVVGSPVEFYLGGEVVSPDGRIESARSLRLDLFLKNEKKPVSGGKLRDQQTWDWGNELVYATRGTRHPTVELYVYADSEMGEAMNQAISKDIGTLVVGYVFMILFACSVLVKGRWRYSHLLLGLASVISVLMSTGCAYGTCWAIGVKFSAMTQILVLLLLGIGIDDTFVIMDSISEHASIPCTKDRIVRATSHAGSAITVTTVTDLMAFLAGSSTVIPGVRDFCYYAAFGIFYDFLYQTTFFVAVAYLDFKRQDSGRADVVMCKKVDEDTGLCMIPFLGGPVKNIHDKGMLHQVAGKRLPQLILGTLAGQVVVVSLTVIFLALAIWGAATIEMDMNIEWMIPMDAEILDTLAVRDMYYKGRNVPLNVYHEGDFAQLQPELVALRESFSQGEYLVDGSVSSWYDAFRQWTRENMTMYKGTPTTDTNGFVREDMFYDLLALYLSAQGPLDARGFVASLRWGDGNGGAGKVPTGAKYMYGYMTVLFNEKATSSGWGSVNAMHDSRKMCAVAAGEALGCRVYAFTFMQWESFAIIVSESIRNTLIAAACVFVICTLLLASVHAGLIVVAIVGFVDLCMFGFMPHWNVTLNNIVVVCLVVAIGFAVDYSVHIAHAFLTVDAFDLPEARAGHQRAGFALYTMGPAVLNGAFSTFLAIIPFAFAVSWAFRVFFKMFALVICFGVWAGVFFLPVVLAWLGPKPYLNAKNITTPENEWRNPLSPTFSHASPTTVSEVEMKMVSVHPRPPVEDEGKVHPQ
eukprot:Sspe_Gene.55505::Locus_30525_Transcript_1_1_Confidence_1.000_Length_2994::g.55505::m.55505